MSETWMAIRPGRLGTRLLALGPGGHTLLKARLETSPAHPRALGMLLEALALWEGGTVRAVLVAGTGAASCDTTLFRECFADFGRLPLYELAYTSSPDRERRPRGRDLLGGFADLRRLLAVEAA